jgi:hypothetical protein
VIHLPFYPDYHSLMATNQALMQEKADFLSSASRVQDTITTLFKTVERMNELLAYERNKKEEIELQLAATTKQLTDERNERELMQTELKALTKKFELRLADEFDTLSVVNK